MPLYLYRCRPCDHVFEELVSADEAASGTPVPCPTCGATETERELTTFAVRNAGSRPEPPPFCGRCGENRPPCGM